jgi:hypothetical protein
LWQVGEEELVVVAGEKVAESALLHMAEQEEELMEEQVEAFVSILRRRKKWV